MTLCFRRTQSAVRAVSAAENGAPKTIGEGARPDPARQVTGLGAGLALHQKAIARCAAVCATAKQRMAEIGLPRFEDVGDLMGNRLDRGAGRIVPMRSTKAGKGGTDGYAARVGDCLRRPGQGFGFGEAELPGHAGGSPGQRR